VQEIAVQTSAPRDRLTDSNSQDVDRERVVLGGVDVRLVFAECETLLVVLFHNLLEYFRGECKALAPGLRQQLLDTSPALRVQGQANSFGIITEDATE
jgi:hypothetical protein